MVIPPIRGHIAPFITSHEPPSRTQRFLAPRLEAQLPHLGKLSGASRTEPATAWGLRVQGLP